MATDWATTLNLGDLESQHGLPAGWLNAVLQAESAGNPQAVSPAGAQGLFQFMPATAKQYGIDPLDPAQAAQGAARYYGDLFKQFGGDPAMAAAAYNWGPGNLSKKGIENAPAETRGYIDKILSAINPISTANAADLSQLSDEELQALAGGNNDDFSAYSDEELLKLAGETPEQTVQAQPEDEDKGFIDGLFTSISNRKDKVDAVIEKQRAGQISLPSAIGYGAAQGANIVNDIAGNAISALTPDFIKEPIKEGAGRAIAYLADTPVGDAVRGVGSAYSDWAAENPEASTNLATLGNAFNAAIGFIPLGGTSNAVGAGATKAGVALKTSAAGTRAARKQAFVEDLILPKQTPTEAAKTFAQSRAGSGLNQAPEFIPTQQQKAIADTVAQLPVRPSNTLLKNYNIISDANRAEADNLAKFLADNDAPIDGVQIVDALRNVQKNLSESPFIVGNGEAASTRVLRGAAEAINKNPMTASGLLKARKDFDKWVSRQKGDKVFDPATDTPVTLTVQQVRQSMNDLIDKAVPLANVRESLTKQSNLYRAMDAVESKGAQAPKTRIGKLKSAVVDGIPGKTVAAKTGAAGALGALGVGSAIASPALVGTALGVGGLYGLGKAVTSPALREGGGRALATLGKFLQDKSQ